MRKLARRLFSLPQDEDLYRPLVLGAPSDSYSTMSHSGATGHPTPEPVFPDARKDDTVGTDAPVVSPQSYDEPIVTRKELWAYYCKCIPSSRFPRSLFLLLCSSILQWRQRGLILLLIFGVAVENSTRVGVI